MRSDKKKIKLKRINKATFLAKPGKAAGGSILEEYMQPTQQGLGLLSGVVDTATPETSTLGSATSMGLKGAQLGASFGPWGAAAGAVGGAALGAIQAKKAQKAKTAQQQEQQTLINRSLLQNAGNSFKHGGKLLAEELHVNKGGNLSPISDDAVEVHANEPSKNDSVELDDAFVDNNEIIDNQKRVFSDSIFLPSGKSVAKEAKKLNKMKAEDYENRFKDANNHIDGKLDSLFNYQEMKKKKNSNHANPVLNSDVVDNTDNLKKGGTIHIKPENKGKFTAYKKRTGKSTEEALHSNDPHVRKMANFAKNAKKWKHEEGGMLGEPPKYKLQDYRAGKYKGVNLTTADYNSLSEQSLALQKERAKMFHSSPDLNTYLDKLLKPSKTSAPLNTAVNKIKYADGGNISRGLNTELPEWSSSVANLQAVAPTNNSENTGSGFNTQAAIANTATFAPNVINSILQKKLKGPASPFLESSNSLQRFSAEPQLAEASRDFGQAQGMINKGTAQGSDLAAASGSLLAKRLNANNQIHGQINQLNAQVNNQEAFLNQGVRARNAGRINQYKSDMVDFQNKKKQMTSENTANLSGKILQQGREKNMMDKDQLALSILGKSYGDSGIYQRNLQSQLQDYMKSKGFKKKGGKINKLYKGGMC